MKQKGENSELFNKKRFEALENERNAYIKGLSIKESIRIFESLTSEQVLNEFFTSFSDDEPVCVRIGLRK